MATATVESFVEAVARGNEARGKNEARRLRVSGKVPGVLYGAKKDPVAVAVDPKQMLRILYSESGHNTIFDLKVGAEQTKAMIVDWQFEPLKGALLHVDLKRIAMDQTLRVTVPIRLTGLAEGVKLGGIMDQVLREVELECLPGDIPAHIDADVTAMQYGDVLRVKDLAHGGKLHFLTNAEQTVAHVTSVKEEVAPTPEAAAEAATAAPAEPEVIKKGKQETAEAVEEPAKGKK
jgi:large subunit ribosomal protein L25